MPFMLPPTGMGTVPRCRRGHLTRRGAKLERNRAKRVDSGVGELLESSCEATRGSRGRWRSEKNILQRIEPNKVGEKLWAIMYK